MGRKLTRGLALAILGVALGGAVLLADEGQPVLLRAEEYIDLDSATVKFLCQTAPGAKVAVHLGESPGDLQPAKTVENHDGAQGLKVGGLTPGREYYYRIAAERDGIRVESEAHSFTKLEITRPRATEWARTSVFYEIFVRSFCDGNGDGIGDFRGLQEKIPYLKDLGVDAVWLMPIFASPSYHGYDISDHYRIAEEYGTNEDFWRFVDEAHRNGLKVILDLVVNHTSAEHPWFLEASLRPNSRYRNYYVWADPYTDPAAPGPWGQKAWYGSDRDRYLAIFGGDTPDLNLRHPRVRAEIKKIARYWLDPNGDGDPADGVDGFRLDAAMHIDHGDPEVTHAWWREFNGYVKSINKDAFLVAENQVAVPAAVAPYFGDLDSSFNFGFATQLLRAAGGGDNDPVGYINQARALFAEYSPSFIDATFLSNHDANRTATVLAEIPERIKLAGALLLTLPGTPFIYYGEEIGQSGAKPDENIREPFDWYAAGRGPGMTDMARWTGTPSRHVRAHDGVSVEEQAGDPQSILNYYRRLIAIRRRYPVLFTGEYRPLDLPGLLAYEVAGADGRPALIVMHNPGRKEIRTRVRAGLHELLTGKKTGRNLVLEPCGTAILAVQ